MLNAGFPNTVVCIKPLTWLKAFCAVETICPKNDDSGRTTNDGSFSFAYASCMNACMRPALYCVAFVDRSFQ